MPKELRKQILDVFQDRLCHEFEDYCKFHDINPNLEHLITYIIDQDLINPSMIQKYALLKEFQERFEGDRGQKTQTVEVLAGRFNVSTRTVWSILKNSEKK
jgi:hypothetical protein